MLMRMQKELKRDACIDLLSNVKNVSHVTVLLDYILMGMLSYSDVHLIRDASKSRNGYVHPIILL